MPSTTALFTAMSGLNAYSRNIDVIGNNVANIGTTAFKSSRLNFSSMFARTLSGGTLPGDATGGTNPFQIGLGVSTAGTQRTMTGGALSPTGDQRDLAIDGKGWFIVDRAGEQLYTRAGSFRTNALGELTTLGGERLLGYGVDENFNLVTGALGTVSIPLGSMTIAESTSEVRFSGNLDADAAVAAQGARVTIGGSSTAGLRALATAAPAPTLPNVLESATRLLDVEDPASAGAPLFSLGQFIELRGAEKGGRTVPPASLAITATTTIDDLSTFLAQALGLNTTTGANPDGFTPGVTIDPLTGVITAVGNTGTANDLTIDSSDLRLLDSAGTLLRQPFVTGKAAEADGESVRTTYVVYDSLGAPVEVDTTLVLESRGNAGTTWRYYVESADATGVPIQVATGTLSFDTQGQAVSTLPVTVGIDRSGTGAASPLAVNLYFSTPEGGLTALADDRSQFAATYRDGAPLGTLTAFSIGTNGVVSGIFTNDLVRTLGQVVVATFTNDEGLLDTGNGLFKSAANSGTAVVAQPGTLGTGQIIAGALEQSNVDLGEEFIRLVLSSTGYSASSRVIRTTDELMQQLLVLGR
ncbi:MAG: flagellar hook-basal body complex protein [Planctomycetota bacterium]|nr:flagellar hook-basal body complex protein [Planctomycetota bacterium]